MKMRKVVRKTLPNALEKKWNWTILKIKKMLNPLIAVQKLLLIAPRMENNQIPQKNSTQIKKHQSVSFIRTHAVFV